MTQRKSWMLYLTIGISLLITGSCRKIIEETVKIDYIYVNQTGQDFNMEIYNTYDENFKTFVIEHEDSIHVLTTNEIGPALFYFDSNLGQIGDSLVIKFSNGKCISYVDDISSSRNKIFDLESYNNYNLGAINSAKTYNLYYTFNQKDYDLSFDCE